MLEDLPSPAGKAVLVRATFDRPLAADPARPLALRRARGLAATVEWLVERGARVTVCGNTEGPDTAGVTEGLDGVRRAVLTASSFGKIPDSVAFRSSPEDPEEVGLLVKRHDLFVNDTLQDSILPLPSLMLPPRSLPSAVGRTLQHDLEILDGLLSDPARPFVAVLGGERSFDRLHGLRGLVLRADTVLLGGALALPMLQALGRQPDDELTEAFLWECRSLIGLSRRVRHQIMVPFDLVWRGADGSVEVSPDDVRHGGEVVDIGPLTRVRFAEVLGTAGLTLWAGALGKVEEPVFAQGTREVAASLTRKAPVVLGGDALVALLGPADLVPPSADMLSATDAAIELLKSGDLPALAALRRPNR